MPTVYRYFNQTILVSEYGLHYLNETLGMGGLGIGRGVFFTRFSIIGFCYGRSAIRHVTSSTMNFGTR
jgi:hypothetical protein